MIKKAVFLFLFLSTGFSYANNNVVTALSDYGHCTKKAAIAQRAVSKSNSYRDIDFKKVLRQCADKRKSYISLYPNDSRKQVSAELKAYEKKMIRDMKATNAWRSQNVFIRKPICLYGIPYRLESTVRIGCTRRAYRCS